MSILRFFGFQHAEPTQEAVRNQPQTQTYADGETCRAAREVCKILSNPNMHNLPWQDALRQTVGSDQAHYLYSRFANQFGWSSLRDAQRFYDANKGSKGGWW